MANNSGRFRKKKVSYSVVSNSIIRNKDISLKAKGLYALIQSYITCDDFVLYKTYLMTLCKEGKSAFNAAWNELKENGYLGQYRCSDSGGKIYYEYELFDEPHTDFRVAENPSTVKPSAENPYYGKSGSILNTDKLNTDKLNTDRVNARTRKHGFEERKYDFAALEEKFIQKINKEEQHGK